MDRTSRLKKKCECGHTQLLTPMKDKEYVLCTWCNRRLYFDEKKQQEHNYKCAKEEFKRNVLLQLELDRLDGLDD